MRTQATQTDVKKQFQMHKDLALSWQSNARIPVSPTENNEKVFNSNIIKWILIFILSLEWCQKVFKQMVLLLIVKANGHQRIQIVIPYKVATRSR